MHVFARDNKCLTLYIYACSLCDIVMTNCWPTEGVYLLYAVCVVIVGVSFRRRYFVVALLNAMSVRATGLGVVVWVLALPNAMSRGIGVRRRCCGVRIMNHNVDVGVG